jgi:hypothetical protein
VPTITVPGHGDVEFPDSMSDADVLAAVRKLAPPTAPAAPPGMGESLARGAGQGATLGFGDEINAGVQALGIKALGQTGAQKSLGQLYKENRDTFRRENEAAKAAHPYVYGAGQIAGGAPLALASGGLGTSTGALVGTGATLGGASALGESNEEGLGGQALDTAKGALLGGAIPAAVTGAGALLRRAAPALRGGAIGLGRKIISNIPHSLSGAPELPAETVQAAFNEGAIVPLGTAKGAGQRLLAARQNLGNQYGNLLDELEARGITGPQRDALLQQYSGAEQNAFLTSQEPGVRRAFATEQRELAHKPDTIPLSISEKLKRSMQGKATSAYQQHAPTEVGQAHMEAASIMRQAVEDEVAKQTAASASPEVQALGQQFVPIKERLAPLIEASKAAQKGAARGSRRNVFSLGDILAASAGASHGGALEGGLTGLAYKVARERAPSTAASGMNALANMIEGTPMTPAQRYSLALAEALRNRALPLAAEEAGGSTSR